MTKEKLLEILEEHPEAKKALMLLFPEMFEHVNLSAIENWEANDLISIRNSVEYKDVAFWLNDEDYHWAFKRDSEDCLCLIPTKK